MQAETYEVEFSFSPEEWEILEQVCIIVTRIREPNNSDIIDTAHSLFKGLIMDNARAIVTQEGTNDD